MKLIQLIKDFLRWKRKNETEVKCCICAYENDCIKVNYCRDCITKHYKWYIPKLKPVSDAMFVNIIISRFLGKDWYVTDPLSRGQINAIALEEVLKKVKI